MLTTIKILTEQDYNKNTNPASGLVFFTTEKDICEIVSNHLSENIKENIETLKMFSKLSVDKTEVYEVCRNKKVLYLHKIEKNTTANSGLAQLGF
jgi:hypothetical protein